MCIYELKEVEAGVKLGYGSGSSLCKAPAVGRKSGSTFIHERLPLFASILKNI